jgi:hypothetical protein
MERILPRDTTRNEGEEDEVDAMSHGELRINTEIPSQLEVLQAIKVSKEWKGIGG